MLRSRVKRLQPTGLRARIAIVTVVGLLASVFAVSGVVGYETYFACVNNSSGTIKVVSSQEECNGGDYFIEWNAQGPPGDSGPMGPQGPQGERGETGVQGEPGEPGAVGPQGETGPVGPQGPSGDQGEPGVAGLQGERGLQGEAGAVGPQGTPGTPGADGISGYEVVTASTGTDFVVAECPAGKVPVGGGGSVPYKAEIFQSKPTATGWLVQGHSDGELLDDWTVTAYAICATTH